MKSLILIDLDAILDTRTGALFDIDPEEAVNILNKGWRTRASDTVEEYSDVITSEQFREAYNARSKYTLAGSRPSNMMKTLIPQIKKLMTSQSQANANLEDYCVVVNVYPYPLTDEECKAVQISVADTIGVMTPVRIVKYGPHEVTLGALEMLEFTDYITYDIRGWIEREFGDITKVEDFTAAPNISIWGPALAISHTAHQDVINDEPDLSEHDDPWEFLSVTFAPFVNLNWINVADVSLLD